MRPLDNIQVLSLAGRLPGPVAVAHLCRLGATAVKVEPPEGDPLFHARPEWYQALHKGQRIVILNLKNEVDRGRLEILLGVADLLVTATRPASLQRLGLSWPDVHARHPRLSQIAVVGHPPPREDLPGHDLTYQAELGLLDPPHLPRALLADWAGAHRIVSTALALILARERGHEPGYAAVSLAEAAADFAEPLRQGLTAPGGLLGGGFAGYNLYRAQDGWVAVAALETHFWSRLARLVGGEAPGAEQLQAFFLTRSCRDWEAWGAEQDLPIVAVREGPLAQE
jgi:crotonobetainyl-CoA:carnitine CoA-transferase CaiB-like acyl-CoA transferase